MRTLFFLSLALLSALPGPASAEIRFQWLSIAGLKLTDGEKTLVFDPVFSRPTLLNWMGLKKMKPSVESIAPWLDSIGLKKADAIFVSHEHFDHSVDAPIVAKLTGATLYTEDNMERIARAYADPEIRTTPFEEGKTVTVGKFKIRAFAHEHSHIRPFGFRFLNGPVPADFNFGFYQYRVGVNFFYVIEHPEGNFIVDQSSSTPMSMAPDLPIRAIFQGIANRASDEAITEGFLARFQPKTFVPTHFDNFFSQSAPNEAKILWGMKFDELKRKIEQRHPSVTFIQPVFGKEEILR